IALQFGLMLDRIVGGCTRPLFGWVSDRTGRELAMTIAFGLEGLALLLLIRHARDPVAFVILTGLAFFGWGAVFSLFPAATTDLFGRKFATTNYGILYTAKGTASLCLLAGNHLQAQTENWTTVFAVLI